MCSFLAQVPIHHHSQSFNDFTLVTTFVVRSSLDVHSLISPAPYCVVSVDVKALYVCVCILHGRLVYGGDIVQHLGTEIVWRALLQRLVAISLKFQPSHVNYAKSILSFSFLIINSRMVFLSNFTTFQVYVPFCLRSHNQANYSSDIALSGLTEFIWQLPLNRFTSEFRCLTTCYTYSFVLAVYQLHILVFG